MPKALKSGPLSNKSPNMVTLNSSSLPAKKIGFLWPNKLALIFSSWPQKVLNSEDSDIKHILLLLAIQKLSLDTPFSIDEWNSLQRKNLLLEKMFLDKLNFYFLTNLRRKHQQQRLESAPGFIFIFSQKSNLLFKVNYVSVATMTLFYHSCLSFRSLQTG